VNAYVPSSRAVKVVLVPVPVLLTEPGLLVIVQVPVDGNPSSTTLPIDNSHVGWVIVPGTGAPGIILTVKVYVAVFAEQNDPSGLSVVTLISITLPSSATAGV